MRKYGPPKRRRRLQPKYQQLCLEGIEEPPLSPEEVSKAFAELRRALKLSDGHAHLLLKEVGC